MSVRMNWNNHTTARMIQFIENHNAPTLTARARALSRQSGNIFGKTISSTAIEKAYYKNRKIQTQTITNVTLSRKEVIDLFRMVKKLGIVIAD